MAKYHVTLHVLWWGAAINGEHYSGDIYICGHGTVDLDQKMTTGLAGRLNKKDGSRVNRPGDKTSRFEDIESLDTAAIETAKKIRPEIKLITVGDYESPPCRVVYCNNNDIKARLVKIYNEYEKYYEPARFNALYDPRDHGHGDTIDALCDQWDDTMLEYIALISIQDQNR